ncbi:MAG: hypothetical protein H6525_02060 [Actinobacteria bacterium]|nr:hypothetical protein [Actinomycetota bacterium]MCB9411625.1 hypothetical protein [Actinomycetota bacterium]
MCFLSALLTWRPRRWLAAVLGGLATFVLLGVTTAVIPNPVFGRSIAPTDWAMEVLVITSVLSGLLFASYVRNEARALEPADKGSRWGTAGGLLAYLAIGCPVCNKVVLIALGSTGAVQFFAPIQPYLGALGIGFLAFALVFRLNREAACAIPAGTPEGSIPALPTSDLLERRGVASSDAHHVRESE